MELRVRMWEISSTTVRYNVTERTTPAIALAGIKDVSQRTMGAKTGGAASKRPIVNFYQTAPTNIKGIAASRVMSSRLRTHRNTDLTQNTHIISP
ncbi:hypothetical protein Agabi119p4_9069 [Agaricus bisporus var. burnettii]|uniref:Uncharacterized protein n=1 Tax=Agaricus bisporus var. burnettii TaxID=192524 RepID=A0A8H7EXU3_AGABI|nr:hypothetical protein Agabi119p4_9069 [Agaricus bisporus var. burnettii]